MTTTRAASLLVVDDEELNRDMLSQRLELNGYTVTAAESGRQAMAFLDRHAFDVVLLDVMMPDLNGLDVLRMLRRTHSAAELPIIMVTARDQSEDVVEAFDLGANDYVTKPIDLPVVLARIATQVSHRRAHAALRESEARYALAARGTNNGLWDWDLRTDEVFFSPRWKAMLGYEEPELGTSPDEWLGRIHPDDLPRVRAALDAHRHGCTPHFESEHRLLHKDQTYRWMLARGLAVCDGSGRGQRMAGSLTDITEGKVIDALTGLPNRILLMDRIGRALERSRRYPDYRFAVLFLDLDRFKMVNDSLGHLIGDQLLTAFARRLQGCLHDCDSIGGWSFEPTIARLGGDEFTILLEDIKESGNAIRVGERIQKELATPFNLGGHDVYVTASIGITLGGPEYDRPEDLLRDADTAMYGAKATGKARHEVFDATMRARAMARLELETELRRALERDEFRLYYQPIVMLQTGQLIGFEALVRWQHPRRGLLLPDDFIEAAEENGLIMPIGRWVLDEACRQLAEWGRRYPGARPLRVCVNLSVRQFSQPNLVEQVERRLRAHGVDARSLKLEITESVIMNDPELATEVLARLRALGVQIGIDDFGTGYSSLNYLRRLPVDTLKIDRTFVERMHADTRDREIIQAIVRLAHNLSMDVVAEGVETHDQRDELRTLGCEHGQGFYFSQAVAGPDAAALLSASQGTPEPATVRGPRTEGNAASRPGEDTELVPAGLSGLEVHRS
jgi:diguanylate cyclase (GGDEF)-like protein/PAS domain S-box-containing protein